MIPVRIARWVQLARQLGMEVQRDDELHMYAINRAGQRHDQLWIFYPTARCERYLFGAELGIRVQQRDVTPMLREMANGC